MNNTRKTEKQVINPADIKIYPKNTLELKPDISHPVNIEFPTNDININAHSNKIALTRFEGPEDSRLTKAFKFNEDGSINKVSSPNFSNGEANTVFIDGLSDIETVIGGLTTNECLATGIFDKDSCSIVTKSNFSDSQYETGTRTRSKEHMSQPETGVVLLDYDQDQHMPESLKCNSPDEAMAKLVRAMPELEGVGYSGASSSSNGIIDEKTGSPYHGGGGMHIYIAAEDIELNQLQQYIEVKLWNAGMGFISFARNGAMLKRTLFDMSVLSPERLIYEARPILGEGVGQNLRVWTHVEGKVFTGDVALTDEEITRYEHHVSDARKSTESIDISEDLQNSYREKQVKRYASEKNISPDEAEKHIPKRSPTDLSKTTQTLDLNESVEIDGQMILVSELVARGEEFDGKAMPDPVEGRDYGLTTAKYYLNDGESPCIHSFAHGVETTYKISVNGQEDSFVKCETTVALTTKSTNLSTSLEAETFPHKSPKKDGSYKLKGTIENVEHLLNGYGITVQYDVIGKEPITNIPGISGISDNVNNIAIERLISLAILNDIPVSQVTSFVGVIAYSNPINPVADWITCKNWDGIDRVQTLCDTLTPRDDFPNNFKDILVKKWLISGVAAVTKPDGFSCRGILTFQGAQKIGKTSWIRRLMPEGLLHDKSILTGHHLDPSNKDSVTTAIKHWIVEIGELDSSFRKDIARLKGFSTQDKDKVRRPYAKTDSEYQRRTVFCATVNEENFLIDATGNSRFWTIPLVEIDYEHNIDMQQVFAQLLVELQKGATWWLTPDEDKQLDELNQAHESVSVIEERVLSIINHDLPEDKWKNKTALEILQAAGVRNPTNRNAQECCAILRKLSYQEKKIRGLKKWLVPIDTSVTSFN